MRRRIGVGQNNVNESCDRLSKADSRTDIAGRNGHAGPRPAPVRRFLAVVPQTSLLFSGSIRENIVYGVDAVDDRRLWEVLEMANAAEFVSKMPHGLDSKLGELGTRLSGGQRQRISIARALVQNPKVIILDEATSSLDVVSESLIQGAIQRLIKGRTTFIVAHRLSTIRNAGRILVLKNGACVESGTHDELMKAKGEFYKYKLLQQ